MFDETVFPRHAASLHLTHNQHKSYHETVEQWMSDGVDWGDWVSAEQKEKAVAADSVWSLQWYPDTPIGFHTLLACDLDVLLAAAHLLTET